MCDSVERENPCYRHFHQWETQAQAGQTKIQNQKNSLPIFHKQVHMHLFNLLKINEDFYLVLNKSLQWASNLVQILGGVMVSGRPGWFQYQKIWEMDANWV